MDPISIAVGLSQFAPALMRLFGAGDKSVAVAERVVGIAQAVTGGKTSEEALAIMQKNSEMQYAFNLKVMENETELEKLYLADTQSARNRDAEFIKSGSRNYRADTMYILAILVIGALVWAVLSSAMDEYAKGIITLVLGRFLGYLDNIYNFEFGSTRSNKDKDVAIKNLSASGKDR